MGHGKIGRTMPRIFVKTSQNIECSCFLYGCPKRLFGFEMPRVHVSNGPEVPLTRNVREFIEFDPGIGRVIPTKIADMISPK
jgi:hypothetical protein